MIVLVAVTFIILIIAAAFSLDIAYMHMVRAELRTATDAAARAGAETLSRTQDEEQAIRAAIETANRNEVAGINLTVTRSDIELGNVTQDTSGRFSFTPGGPDLTTVRVSGRRSAGAPDGPVALFFGPVLGTSNFQPEQRASATASVRDIAIVLDRSGSMATVEGGVSRIDALKQAVTAFFDEIAFSSPNSNASLVTYSTSATRDIELTNNFAVIQSQVNQLRPRGFTNIFQAIRFGSDSLEAAGRRPFADRTIIVMTDGNFNVGGDPTPSARVAAARGHTIHTVTFSSGANQGIMQDVARIGGGVHLHADDAGDLKEAFREIARTISVLLIE